MKRTGRRPSVRPNVRRQAGYAAVALLAVLIGYGSGVLFKSGPTEAPRSAVPPGEPLPTEGTKTGGLPKTAVYPEGLRAPAGTPVLAFEEALPAEVHEPEAKIDAVDHPPSVGAVTIPRWPQPDAESLAPDVLPPWRRHAVAFPDPGFRPKIVVVIDDLGMDRKRTARSIGLKGPLTLSFLTYAEDLAAQTDAGRAAGHELLMHVGMEPLGEDVDPGPDVLVTGVDAGETRRLFERLLGRFDGYVGINNHMGSRFTEDVTGMTVVMEVLKRRGLLFLDSLTTGRSLGSRLARQAGVPFAERNVFLDNVDEVAAINERLRALEQLARRRGYAVAIGHPRDATLDALEGWLDGLDDRGFALVPLSAVVVADAGGGLGSGGRNGDAPQARKDERPGPPGRAEGAVHNRM